MLPPKFTFIDVETTGTSYWKDRIIEIGIIQTENGEIINQFNSLINPQKHVPESILEMTGISAPELEDAPTFRDVHQEIGQLLADSVFVAHNAAFDYGFIKNEFKILEFDYSSKCLCTVKLSRALFPRYKSHNLDSLIKRFNFDCENRHRALDDAKVMVDFVNLVKTQFSVEKVEKAINRILKRPSTPLGISEKTLDNLPETPGVYIFYGETQLPLYIGKSINIRNRVLSHFSAVSLSSNELKIASQVKHIETISTGGELGALLKESDLIKKMQPIYNRRLRNASKPVYLGYQLSAAGYKEVITSVYPPDEILGIYKSQKQLKENLDALCEQHNLCKKLLGLEKSKTCCFGYQIGKCKGACVGEETALKYNLRFDLAFIQTKVKSWPFNGPVIVSEGDEKFIVNNWRYKKLSEEDQDLNINSDELFDMDTYRILSRYIYSERNRESIRVHSSYPIVSNT